jgi:hypothetical protein
MFNLIFLPRFGHQKSLDLGGKVAPLIEKVKVAQETTENAKLQLREAPEMSFFEIKIEKYSEASDHPVHDDSHKIMFFKIHQTHQILNMFGILAASL